MDTESITKLAQKSELTFRPTQPGIVRCFAENSEGKDLAEAELRISDIDVSFYSAL